VAGAAHRHKKLNPRRGGGDGCRPAPWHGAGRPRLPVTAPGSWERPPPAEAGVRVRPFRPATAPDTRRRSVPGSGVGTNPAIPELNPRSQTREVALAPRAN